MAFPLTRADFQEGGKFFDVDIPTELPLPVKIFKYIYHKSTPKCDKHINKISQMGMLKSIWRLKDVQMEWCLCKQDHLVPLEEYILVKRDFSASQI